MTSLHELPAWARGTREWALIESHYHDRVAERSQVPLINHIVEGVNVMEALTSGAPYARFAARAFMLHPLVQAQADFDANMQYLMADGEVSRDVLVLVLEYRRAANAYLCKRHTDSWGIDIVREQVGPLRVGDLLRDMLIADKWQNQKDFRAHHLGTHPRSAMLEAYFNTWQRLLDPDGSVWPSLDFRFGLAPL